ncbi:4Fe-4S dicluster domain-containing protein [bacterium]|nr:4Fe-4S dicluster domain-containing protein [candidate division CSSED10-310 bacterium]
MHFSWFSKLILLVCIVGFVGYFVREVLVKIRQVRKGRPLDVWSDMPVRIKKFLVNVILQRQVITGRVLAGTAHALVFWGFLFFSIGTLEHFSIGFGAPQWLPDLYHVFLILIAWLTLLGVFYLAVRRFVMKPKSLTHPSPESAAVLSLIAILMLTYIAGYHMDGTGFVAKTTWWVHSMSVLVFLALIVNSKHLHLVFSPFNTMFKSLTFAALDTPDYEKMFEEMEAAGDDREPEMGAGRLDALTWKDRFDFYTCIECGRCQDQCPAYNTNKDLNPKMLIQYGKKQLRAKDESIPAEIDAMIWQCTNCGGCEYHCPLGIEFIGKITEFRRYKVQTISEFPREATAMFKGLEKNANPWGLGTPEEFDVPEFDAETHEYLLFLGCFARYSPDYIKVAHTVVDVLTMAGVSFGVIAEEGCCGDPARSLGNEFVYQELAKVNIEMFNEHKVTKIVTACPHCARRLGTDYRDLGGRYEVIHHSELLEHLAGAGRLRIKKGDYIFHDPCFMSRYQGSYSLQRSFLTRGGSLHDPAKSKLTSFCCGGGGGMMFLEEKYSKGEDASIPKISHTRMRQLLQDADDQPIVTSCPYCFTMLRDAVKEMSLEREIIDISQVVDGR